MRQDLCSKESATLLSSASGRQQGVNDDDDDGDGQTDGRRETDGRNGRADGRNGRADGRADGTHTSACDDEAVGQLQGYYDCRQSFL